jgi:hypothetical protein
MSDEPSCDKNITHKRMNKYHANLPTVGRQHPTKHKIN